MSELTRRILSERNGPGRRELLEEVYLLVYRYPMQQIGRNEEECAGFFLYCHNCVTRMVDRFRDQGSDFEAYLGVFLRYKLKGYRMQLRAQEDRRRDAQEDWFRYGCPESDDGQCATYQRSLAGRRLFSRSNGTELRRRELLLLTCCPGMTDDQVYSAAVGLGLDPESTLVRARRLREMAEPRRKRREMLAVRIDRCRARIRMLERSSDHEPYEQARKALAAKIAAEQRRLAQLRTVIALVPTRASHREVATVMEIPKGTVDSGMFYLQRQFAAETARTYDAADDPACDKQCPQAFGVPTDSSGRGTPKPG